MANFFKNAKSNSLTTSLADIYICPSNTESIILGIQVSNIDGANSADVDVVWIDSSDSDTVTYLVKGAGVTAGEAISAMVSDFQLVLEAGDKIQAKASVASDLAISVTVVESFGVGDTSAMAISPTRIADILEAGDGADNDKFGRSCTLSSDGSILAVGAFSWEGATGTDRGGVYVYDWSGSAWVQRGSVIEASDAADSDGFGISCALSSDGSILAVGAYAWEGASGSDRGGVYVYDWSGSAWTQRGSVIEASDAADSDYFGMSCTLSADGSILAVGARNWEGTAGSARGGVYIYDWSGSAWVQRGSVIEASDAADSDLFGASCALSSDGSILAVGAQAWEGATGTDRGGVYIYDWSGSAWVQRGSVIEASDAADSDGFGVSCVLSSDGSILAVGAYTWEGTSGSNRGGVYIYDWSGSAWTQRGSVIEASDAADSDGFGISCTLSADGSILAVGAFSWEGTTGTDRGAVYTYSLTLNRIMQAAYAANYPFS